METVEKTQIVEEVTKYFLSGESAQKGAIILNGTNNSEIVQKAIKDNSKVDYNKSVELSAALIYAKLYLNKSKGDVIVFDDCYFGETRHAKVSILDMLKAATEMTKGERIVAWMRASRSQLMLDNNVPAEFDFQGSIIIVTNSTLPKLQEFSGNQWEALADRFMIISA